MPRRKLVGVRKVGTGFEVYGKVAGQQFSRRFPAGTPEPVMRAWRESRIQELEALRPALAQAGTLASDVERFVGRWQGLRRDFFSVNLKPWVEIFGNRSRYAISTAEIQSVLNTWRASGLAASTVNHRRGVLASLYKGIDHTLPNPARATLGFKLPEPEPRAVPDEVAIKVFEHMNTHKTLARLLCLYHTGMRPAELRQVTREDVCWEDDNPYVRVPSKKGGRPRVVPLHQQALASFYLLDQVNGWGYFNNVTLHQQWRKAGRKAGLPIERWRVYDLRHRFATRLREHGADLADVQEILGHKDIRTTRRYAPVVHAKLRSVVERVVAS